MKKDSIVHFEIPANDVQRAMDFYQKSFGWEFHKFDMPGEAEPYYGVTTTEVDEKHQPKKPGAINGGLMKRKHPDQPFMNYITVESIDEKLVVVKENGGEICMPKTEIGSGMGWIACFKDPEGNMMGLHELSAEHQKMANQ
jgi:predicted enzyme related to lactoylglutathione lyase